MLGPAQAFRLQDEVRSKVVDQSYVALRVYSLSDGDAEREGAASLVDVGFAAAGWLRVDGVQPLPLQHVYALDSMDDRVARRCCARRVGKASR